MHDAYLRLMHYFGGRCIQLQRFVRYPLVFGHGGECILPFGHLLPDNVSWLLMGPFIDNEV